MELGLLRRGFWIALVTVGLVVAAAGLLYRSSASRLPVAEARRFFRDPIVVGDEPPLATGEPASDEATEQRYAEARAAFRDGDYTTAARAFADTVALNPRGPNAGDAQWNLVRANLRSGNGNEAITTLMGLLSGYGGYLAERAPKLREGLDLMEANRVAEADAAFLAMAAEQPDSDLVPLAHAMRARIHWTHGKPFKTVSAFVQVFRSVKDDVEAYDGLADLLERYAEGDNEVAEEFAEQAKVAPEGFRDIFQYLSARSYLEQNRFDEAQVELERLRELDPKGDFSHIVDLEHAWNNFNNARFEEALAIFQQLETRPDPEYANAFNEFFDIRAELPWGVGRCYAELGEYEKAILHFERALAEYPDTIYQVEIQLGIALAHEKLGHRDEAVSRLEKLIAEHPEEPNLWAIQQQLSRVEAGPPARN